MLLTDRMRRILRQIQVPVDPRSFTLLAVPVESLAARRHLRMSAEDVNGVSIPAETSNSRHMIRSMPESNSPSKAMPIGETEIPVKATMAPAKFIRLGMVVTRLVKANHLGIRHQTHLVNVMVPGVLLSIKVVIQGQTVMMMVIRLWREPVTRGMNVWCPRARLEPGWDLASCRHMMPAPSSTEYICLNFLRSKALLVLLALDPGLCGSRRC